MVTHTEKEGWIDGKHPHISNSELNEVHPTPFCLFQTAKQRLQTVSALDWILLTEAK